MEESWRMDGSGSGAGKLFGRFSEPAHRVLDLAPGQSRAARVLRAHGMDLMAARAALARLATGGSCRHRDRAMPSYWAPWAFNLDAVGLPEGDQGAAGLLLAALGVNLDHLREAVAAEVVGVQR
jgi:hypothetical protein